ncbi:MAG: hypothetical protein WC289_04875 [Patescibacteria group bacterium]|jgi:hypothetical protein
MSEREFTFSPEVQSIEQPKSARELLQEVSTNIKNFVDHYLGKPDKQLQEYINKMHSSGNLGSSAGEYMRSLIPRSLSKPDISYVHDDKPGILENSSAGTLEFLKSARRRHFKGSYEEIQDSHIRKRMDTSPKTQFVEYANILKHCTVQHGIYQYAQEGGSNSISEMVQNDLYTDWNDASGTVVMTDKKTGMKLDFSKLIPSGYTLRSSVLNKFEKQYDKETRKEKVTLYPQSLKEYSGSNSQEGTFRALLGREGGSVEYGDLAKKGGILRLLHEIAHGWQGKYYSKVHTQSNFEDYLQRARALTLAYNMLIGESNNGDEDAKEASKIVLKELLDRQVQLPSKIEDDESQAINPDVKSEIDEDHIVFQNDAHIHELMKEYESSERDAWTHAIRLVRFLRSQGMDIEPELHTLADFQSVIDPALNSYQSLLEQHVTILDRPIQFSRRPFKNQSEDEPSLDGIEKGGANVNV